MGHHFVPQQHLRRFSLTENPKLVWMFDRDVLDFRKVSIKSAAQQPSFYSPETEKTLAGIEARGNNAIDKLLKREVISRFERRCLAAHILILANRSPSQRERMAGLTKQIYSEVQREFRDKIEQNILAGGTREERAREDLAEQERIERESKDRLPKRLDQLTRIPFGSERAVRCIIDMTWHIVPAPPQMFYVTSDTPAHIFDDGKIGLINAHSELTITLSKDIALVGTNKGKSGSIVFEKPMRRITAEVNHRMLSKREDRFIYSHDTFDWIERFASIDYTVPKNLRRLRRPIIR